MYNVEHAIQFSADAGRNMVRAYASDLELIVPALIAAEDHRASHHSGIDIRSLIRGLRTSALRLSLKPAGVSTIEQQLVRIIYPRAGRNIFVCKFNELILSYRLSKRISKLALWCAYLQSAYYGTDLQGYEQVRNHFCGEGALTEKRAIQIVSCLKYPRPRQPTPAWNARHKARNSYVAARLASDRLW